MNEVGTDNAICNGSCFFYRYKLQWSLSNQHFLRKPTWRLPLPYPIVVALLCFANRVIEAGSPPDDSSNKRRCVDHHTPVVAYRTDFRLKVFNPAIHDEATLSFKANNPCKSSAEGKAIASKTHDTSFCRLSQLVGHTDHMPVGWLEHSNRLHGSIELNSDMS